MGGFDIEVCSFDVITYSGPLPQASAGFPLPRAGTGAGLDAGAGGIPAGRGGGVPEMRMYGWGRHCTSSCFRDALPGLHVELLTGSGKLGEGC